MQPKIKQAYRELERLVLEEGKEYPDAQACVVEQFGLTDAQSEELQRMYDKGCA